MVEYRPLAEEELDVYFEYTRYAFSPESGPVEYDPEEHDTEALRLGAQRGLFPDDAATGDPPRCVCTHYWFDALVRGERHPAPGLAAVATPPEHRRGGNVARLLERSLAEYRERGARFSLLWPFRTRFYRQYGWETSSEHRSYACDPEALSFAAGAGDGGRYGQIDADEYPAIEPVYEAQAGRYALSVTRDEDWWRHRVFRSGSRTPYVYAWERDGEARGYSVYAIDGEWGDRTMKVRELAFVDHDALRAMLAFVANHDSQVEEVEFALPADVDLLDLVSDPEDVDCSLEPGPMARVVDVVDSLSALSYPDVEVGLTVSVEDPVVEANDGTFALEASGGEATCQPASEARDADAVLDVGALTQLAVGFRSAADLERAGRLEASPESAEALGRLFPPDDAYLGTRF